ncbi:MULTISPECIES: hypothetical protein, partial [unclassified Collinsella]|uniref:hypothetical protein n=1 Tax=unclassified Collinsella TaxID=2637548 RepID=UPI001E46A964
EAVPSLEEPDRRLPGLDVVFHSQVDTHKKPPISRVQEMGGSSQCIPRFHLSQRPIFNKNNQTNPAEEHAG